MTSKDFKQAIKILYAELAPTTKDFETIDEVIPALSEHDAVLAEKILAMKDSFDDVVKHLKKKMEQN